MPDHRSGFFWGELLHPYEQFSAAGWDCDIVSETGAATVDESSVGSMATGGEKAKWEDKKFPLHNKLASIQKPKQVNSANYAAIYFAGGHAACSDFPKATGLQHLAATIYEAGGVVGADCHGPAIFENMLLSNGTNILQGKRATGFSTKAEESFKALDWMKQNGFHTMQEVVGKAGGLWHEHPSNPMSEYTECDARVVTGMNPASAAKCAKDMMAMLPCN